MDKQKLVSDCWDMIITEGYLVPSKDTFMLLTQMEMVEAIVYKTIEALDERKN